MFKKYLDIVNLVLLRPILFYTRIPAGEWTDEPVTFCGVISWVIGLFMAAVIFVNQLGPIGVTLFEKVSGWKVVLVSPVMAVLAFIFFVMICAIIGGILMAAMLGLFCALGWLLHFGGLLMGGKAEPKISLKASLYSSAAALIMILPVLTVFFTKKGFMDFTNFQIGYNIVYGLFVVYLYGLLAIASRKTQGIERWKAFVAALLPAALLLVFGILVGAAILPKLKNWVI